MADTSLIEDQRRLLIRVYQIIKALQTFTF